MQSLVAHLKKVHRECEAAKIASTSTHFRYTENDLRDPHKKRLYDIENRQNFSEFQSASKMLKDVLNGKHELTRGMTLESIQEYYKIALSEIKMEDQYAEDNVKVPTNRVKV